MAKKKATRTVPRELKLSGALCLAFANGAAPRHDGRRPGAPARPWVELSTYADLLAWCRRLDVLSEAAHDRLATAAGDRPADAAAALARALQLRDTLASLFTAHASGEEPEADSLDLLNELLPAAAPVVRLVRRDGAYHQELVDGDGLEAPLGPIVLSAADLLSSDRLSRVRQCRASHCTRLFVSRTARRWCDMNVCGNRGKGRRYQRSIKTLREGMSRRVPGAPGRGRWPAR